MPGVDGYEACRRIREKWGNVLPLIAITGWGQESDKELALHAGFDAHLTKPVDPESLSASNANLRNLTFL